MKGGAAMTKSEIIEIVQSMDHQSDFRSYYQFAHSYLRQMQNNGIREAVAFWNVVRHCQKSAESKNTIQALGRSGTAIKRWCAYLLNNRHLAEAGIDDLCSIFGYCAHLGNH